MKINFTKLLFTLLVCLGMGINIQAQDDPADATLEVNNPANIAGSYDMWTANWGPAASCEFTGVTGNLKIGDNGSGGTLGCDDGGGVTNDLTNYVAILDRGDCAFVQKVANAQAQGAIAVIICNVEGRDSGGLGGSLEMSVPAFMLGYADCQTIRAEIANGDVNVTGTTYLGEAGGENPNAPVDPNAGDMVVYESTFANGLGDWESNELLGNSGEDWAWTDNNAGRGALGGFVCQSPSSCDGGVIYDLDFFTTQGESDNIPGGGPPYPQHSAELVSPSIDLSSVDIPGVKFYQMNEPLNGTTQFSFSTDGGSTWSDPIDIETASSGRSATTEIVRFPILEAANQSDVKIKFIIDGDFYYWIIDDVQVFEFPTNTDAAINDAFYTPLTYAQPMGHLDRDGYSFQATLSNKGGTELTDAIFKVEIKNDSSGETIHSQEGVVESLGIGETGDFVLNPEDPYYLPNDLSPGLYSINYSLSATSGEDTDLSNNEFTHYFEVTDFQFRQDNETLNTSISGRAGEGWKLGAAYLTSANINTDDIFVKSVEVSVGHDGGESLENNYMEVFLTTLADGVEYSFEGFDRAEVDIRSNSSLNIEKEIFHFFDGSEENFGILELPVSTDEEVMNLKANATYVLLLAFDTQNAGSELANDAIDIGATSQVEQSGNYLVLDSDQWYTGWTNMDAPIMRMNLRTPTNVENTLEEEALKVYPNPTSDYITASLQFDKPTDVAIIVANMEGKVFSIQDVNGVTKGEHTINVSNLPAGNYFLKVSTPEGKKTQQFSVVR